MKTLLTAFAALLTAQLFTAASAMAARDSSEFLVLGVAGPSQIRTGAVLDPGQEVEVARGATILVLARSGEVLRLTGPCLCRLPGEPLPLRALPKPRGTTRGFQVESDLWEVALPNLKTLSEPAAPAPPGTSRGAKPGEAAKPPDLWAVAVDSSGNRCVRRGETYLWRRQAAEAVVVDLRARAARETGIVWPAGQPTLRLPSQFVEDGAPLVLQINDEPRRLVVHVLPETIEESQWGEILIWMAARDCRRQAQFLVDGLNDGSLFPDRDRRPGLSEL